MSRHARPIIAVFVCLLLAAGACGGPKGKTGSSAAQHVGAAITVEKPTPVAALVENAAGFSGQTVKIEGTVKAVCQGRGCWVEVVDKNGKSFMARSLDDSVLLPLDCAGRKIVVQGVVTAMPSEAKAEAEGAAAEGHACPKPDYVVATQGVDLR